MRGCGIRRDVDLSADLPFYQPKCVVYQPVLEFISQNECLISQSTVFGKFRRPSGCLQPIPADVRQPIAPSAKHRHPSRHHLRRPQT